MGVATEKVVGEHDDDDTGMTMRMMIMWLKTISRIHDPTPIWDTPCSLQIASASWLPPSHGPLAPSPKPYLTHEPDPAVLVGVVEILLFRCPLARETVAGQRMKLISNNKSAQ